MSEVLKANIPHVSRAGGGGWSLASYLPALLPIVGALLMVLLRIQMGGARFIDDGSMSYPYHRKEEEISRATGKTRLTSRVPGIKQHRENRRAK